jgi:hypothetical protein
VKSLGVRFLISGVMVVTLPLPHRELTSIMPGSLNREPLPIHKYIMMFFAFVGLAYQGKDIVFRFILEYISLRSLAPR